MVRAKYKLRNFSSSPFPVVLLVPNIVTLLSLCSGLSALKFAIAAKWEFALIAIFFSALFDVLDGSLARILKATSVFGAQLDSLSDFICFGVVPGFIMYLWNFQKYGIFGWFSVIMYILCLVIRLARFNTDAIKDNLNNLSNKKQEWQMMFFKGVPAPAAAMLVLLPIILENHDGFCMRIVDFAGSNIILPIYVGIVALLAVSKIPTFSIKKLKIKNTNFSLIMLMLGLSIVSLINYPWKIIPVLLLIYIFSLFISVVKYNQEKKKNTPQSVN